MCVCFPAWRPVSPARAPCPQPVPSVARERVFRVWAMRRFFFPVRRVVGGGDERERVKVGEPLWGERWREIAWTPKTHTHTHTHTHTRTHTRTHTHTHTQVIQLERKHLLSLFPLPSPLSPFPHICAVPCPIPLRPAPMAPTRSSRRSPPILRSGCLLLSPTRPHPPSLTTTTTTTTLPADAHEPAAKAPPARKGRHHEDHQGQPQVLEAKRRGGLRGTCLLGAQ